MFKHAIRAAPRRILASQNVNVLRRASGRRLLSTAPPVKRARGWKSGALRWGIAAAGVYYYNTNNVFAEEPEAAIQRTEASLQAVKESNQPTIDAIVEEKRHREALAAAEAEEKNKAQEQKAFESVTATEGETEAGNEGEEGDGGIEGLEEEAHEEGAFNPETGEINWDCPCLGGMAHGPCGEEFRAAFSCFVYSKEEPKGVECIEKFKGMQDCFRAHPEMYGAELEDEEDEIEEEIRSREAEKDSEGGPSKPASESTDEPTYKKRSPGRKPAPAGEEPPKNSQSTTGENVQKGDDEGEELVPKAALDSTSK